MAQQYFHNPAKQDIIEQPHDYLWQEKDHEQQIENEATTIRRYSIKKFIEVTTTDGEQLIGYESPTMNIFYYRPGMMTFVAMHTTACHCNMCEWVYKPPITRNQNVRHSPYQYGKRTPTNKNQPRSPTPKKERSISPTVKREQSNSPSTNWEDLADHCHWEEDPFGLNTKPVNETRELN